jgi:hypothetical protein
MIDSYLAFYEVCDRAIEIHRVVPGLHNMEDIDEHDNLQNQERERTLKNIIKNRHSFNRTRSRNRFLLSDRYGMSG